MKESTKLRGILLPSKILDYLSQEDVEKKIEALLEKDQEEAARSKEELKNALESSLPGEEKERLIQQMFNESLTGKASIERQQRMAALTLRRDYAELKKNENRAFRALLAGDFGKYERCITKASDVADLVDMGLEYIENLPEFFSAFKVTKVSILSEEEAKQKELSKDLSKVMRVKSLDSFFGA